MENILKTTDLCKSFKGQAAVNNVSFSIEKNSVYGLLGPNGAGKSTTLKMITNNVRKAHSFRGGMDSTKINYAFVPCKTGAGC